MLRLPHRHLVTVATNVPGPPVPLYLCDRRMQGYPPYVPLGDRLHLGIAITSYDGVLSFGVTADAAEVDAVPVLLAGIDHEARALLTLSTLPASRAGA